MRKVAIFLACVLPIMARGAPDYARAGAPMGRAGPMAPIQRLTIPVETTSTTTTYIPETTETTETSNVYDIEIPPQPAAQSDLPASASGGYDARTACLMVPGNLWASKMNYNPVGVPASGYLREEADQSQNACFSPVSFRSSDKKLAGLNSQRYFQQGMSATCGGHMGEKEMEAAILDATKAERVGWTIAASVGGAGVGVGATELIGRNFVDGFEGQKDMEDEVGLVSSHYLDMRRKGGDAASAYLSKLSDLSVKCGQLEGAKAVDPVNKECEKIAAAMKLIGGSN